MTIILNKIKRLDYIIFIILACLTGMSTVLIYSATDGTIFSGMHRDNMIMFGLFCIPLLVTAFFNYRIAIKYMSIVFFLIGIGLLVYTHYKGVNHFNAQRWIAIKGEDFQPSEVVKIFIILLLAFLFARRNGEPLRLFKDVIPAGILVLIPFYLVYKQPDLGTALVFFGIFVGMLWMGNIRIPLMLVFVILITAVVSLVIWLYYNDMETLQHILKPKQITRIQTFLEPTKDPDTSWHVINSMTAISTGELAGKGFMQGYFIHNGFVPVLYSDSIFVVIGEEFGFLGTAVLLLLYFILIYRMVLIAMECTDLAGRYMVIGIVSMWVVQIFENIGMHIGLLPLTGIALPFISYGGSSLLTNMIAVGLVLSVRIYEPVELAKRS